MFPGLTTKLSESTLAAAATIDPKTDIAKITGTTQINTILTHFGPTFSGILYLVPVDGDVVLGNSGNIATGGGSSVTAHQNLLTELVFVRSTGKWYPNDRT